MVTGYPDLMVPFYTHAFDMNTVTPAVCAWCGGIACADGPPGRAVLRFEVESNAAWEVPAIEIGARCIRQEAYQLGAPAPEANAKLTAQLQAAEEALAEARAREDDAAAAAQPVLDLLERHTKVAALAAVNAYRKDAAAAKANGAAS